MEMSIFITALCVSIIYLLMKFLEMRVIEKANKPLKLLARDTLLVYLSVLTGHFILIQLSPMTNTGTVPQVFTAEPDF
jgi:hypothetical protein|uniref:Uncharacterized protein n=1 Tax=viral metagenome TaxID=1070528 RepID=A0A6C0ALL9_9ZZZZ